MATVTDLIARYDYLVSRRNNYEGQIADCAKFIRPLRNNFNLTTSSEGMPVASDVTDSTALDANKKLGSRMAGTICSQQIRWLGVRLRDDRINELDSVRKWWDAVELQMLLALRQSAFYAEINETLTDLPGLGTGGIFIDAMPAKPNRPFTGLTCRAVGVGEFAIDEGADGMVDEVWREFILSARAANDRWPGKLSERTMKFAENKPGTPISILHGVFPRESPPEDKFDRATGVPIPRSPSEMPYVSVYIEKEAKQIITEGGFEEMPYAIGRWSRPAGDIYGWGIGHDALPYVKTLNLSQEMFLKQFAIAIQPPLIERHNSVFGAVKLLPGARNKARTTEDIKEFITAARFDVTGVGIKELRDAVRAMWFDDQLSLRESSRMTTVEVYARLELMQQLLGPNVGRIMYEVFNRAIERIFGIMLRGRAFPPAPPELIEYTMAQGQWDVEYQSPLARAQRTPELTAIDRVMQVIATMAPVFPEVRFAVKAMDTIRHAAQVAGMPAALMNTPEEAEALRQSDAQQQAINQEIARAAAVAQGVGQAAPMVKALTPQNGGAA
ncbi:MAG: portal protein [Bryobacteraceae bacterium]